MPNQTVAIVAGEVMPVANDFGGASRGRADVRYLRRDAVVTPRRNRIADTLLFVDQGTLEVMIEGASGRLGAGEFMRVPAGHHCAYRNAGDGPARVLSVQMNDADRRNVTARVIAGVVAA